MIGNAALDRQAILGEIDRVINEMVKLRAQVAMVEAAPSDAPSKSWSAFGMWADRADMQGMSSIEWLDQLRREQWGPRDDRAA